METHEMIKALLMSLAILSEHPRIFATQETTPSIRARVTSTHATEWAKVTSEVQRYGSSDRPTTGAWNQSMVRGYSKKLNNLATAYFITGNTTYRDLLIDWLTVCKDHAIIQYSHYGEDATWSGFVHAYDVLYNDPAFLPIKDEVEQWLYDITTGSFGVLQDLEYKNYYKYPWIAGSAFCTLLAIHGEISDPDFDRRLNVAYRHVQNDFKARALNYCGTYSGYRWERPWEDMVTAVAWDNATNDEPFVQYANHLEMIGIWGMYATRPGWFESDEVGDNHDLAELHTTFVDFALPTKNPEALWWIDKATAAGNSSAHYWRILVEDRSLPRKAPTNLPLGKYFGDLTRRDGGNSRYAYMRSSFNYDNDSTVVVTLLPGGPIFPGHVYASSHHAFFRGKTILSASTGVYDGTAKPHFKYHSSPISENTILISDPSTPYKPGGQQSRGQVPPSAPDLDTPTGPFQSDYEVGFIDKFVIGGGVQYAHMNCTLLYPNTVKPSQWPNGAIVKNVTRSICLVAGRFVVNIDRISTLRPTAKVAIVMHCPSSDGFSLYEGGKWDGGTPPNAHGGTPGQYTLDKSYTWSRDNSRVHASVLYDGYLEIWRLGGKSASGEWNKRDSYEFIHPDTGENIPYDTQYVSGAEERKVIDSGWAGFWRSEIRVTGETEYTIPHVYELTDKSRDPVIVELLPHVNDGRIGITIYEERATRVLVFSEDEELDVEVIYDLGIMSESSNFVADLEPGSYVWETETEEGVFDVNENGVGYFTVENGGIVRLAQGAVTPPPPPPRIDRFLTVATYDTTAYQWRIVRDGGPSVQGAWYHGPDSPGFYNGYAAKGDSIFCPNVGDDWKYVIVTWPATQAGPDSVYKYEEDKNAGPPHE
jgi:hypothetical protein